MEEFVVTTRSVRKLSWDDFKKKVRNIDEPRDLLSFAQSKTLSQREFSFLLNRLEFIYSNMRKELFTTTQLSTSSRLFKYLIGVAANFDIGDYLEYKKALDDGKDIPELSQKDFRDHEREFQKHFARIINALNTLIEFEADAVEDSEYLAYLLSLSLDPNKFHGPIAKKLSRRDKFCFV